MRTFGGPAPAALQGPETELPPNRPVDRADLAVEIGFLTADGFLAVNSDNLRDIELLATNLARYGDGLGAGERVTGHANALLESAENKDVASGVVTTTCTPERAKRLMREDITDYHQHSISSQKTDPPRPPSPSR